MLRNVFLYGDLAEKYGEVHRFDIGSVGEAVRALEANFPGFKRSIDREANYIVVRGEDLATGEALDDYNPLKHTFADGCYIREIFSPANQLMVSKIHKKEHPYFLMSGKLSILTEDGVKHLVAPCNGITKPGTKRIIYTHTASLIFPTVHTAAEITMIGQILILLILRFLTILTEEY